MTEPTTNGQQWPPTADVQPAPYSDGGSSTDTLPDSDVLTGDVYGRDGAVVTGELPRFDQHVEPDAPRYDAEGSAPARHTAPTLPPVMVLPAPITPDAVFPRPEPEPAPEPTATAAMPVSDLPVMPPSVDAEPVSHLPSGGWGTPTFLDTHVTDQEAPPSSVVFDTPVEDVAPATDDREPVLPTPEPVAEPAPASSLRFAPLPQHSAPKAAEADGRAARDPHGPVLPPAAAEPGVSTAERVEDDQGDILDDYLRAVIALGGSDLHLSPGSQPRIRVHGDLRPIDGAPVLTDDTLRKMIEATLMSPQKTEFEQRHELNFSYEIAGEGRFRGNLMLRGNSYAAVYRLIPWQIKTLGELNMPKKLADFAQLHRGLVLVTGATGSGKSTTLAAIIDLANRTRDGHILTIEDPVEFVHQHQKCVVNQREVGPDTSSFAEALRNALRQDPDIILVGEMRDLETIQVALTAAETGHLVLGTLHTSSAKDTINRIIDAFPANQQDQVRTQLSSSLTAVLCQTLCKTIDGKGRAAATELMISDTSIKTAIRDAKIQQIPNSIQQGRANGMHTLAASLAELVKADKIGAVEAGEKAYDRAELALALGIDKDQVDGFARYQDEQMRRINARSGFGNGFGGFSR